MKKSMVALLLSGIISGAASAQSVSSANIVGYVQRELAPGKYTLIGVNFLANGEQPTLKDVVGTNQLKAASNYLNADRVVVWNPQTSSYQAYAQYDGDREFYPCNTAHQWNNSSATNPVIPVGTGFWIISATATNKNIYLSGDVVSDQSVTLNLDVGYQLLAWPFACDQDIADMTTTNLTKSANYLNADRIVVWEGDKYQQYGLYTDGKWYPCNTAKEWADAVESADRKISLGEGFWFIGRSSKSVTEQNPYYDNIR